MTRGSPTVRATLAGTALALVAFACGGEAPSTPSAGTHVTPARAPSDAKPSTDVAVDPVGAAPRASAPSPVDATIADAVAWLVEHQNPDGSWGSHHSPRPIEVLASIPGSQEAFRVATTALCVIALTDARDASPGVREAREKALDWLLANCAVKRQDGLEHYNVWAFGYALQCFGEQLSASPEDARSASLRAACEKLLEKLAQYQTLDGGWGYLSINGVATFQPSDTSMSFTTATILVGMQRARAAGIALPETMTKRAVDHVERSRLPDGAFLYGEYLKYRPRLGINVLAGSACRNPLCLYTLELFGGKVSEADYRTSLEDLLVKYAPYQRAGVRRPMPHESWYQVSGYFYLYGHAYAAYVMEKLPAVQQEKFRPALIDAVMYCRQPDGSFWDYPLYSYHAPYGTAFAIIALARCRASADE